MRKISVNIISNTVRYLCVKANISLRSDVLRVLKMAQKLEKNKRAKNIISILLENARIAQKEGIAICQDTGMAEVFVELGQGVNITGGDLSGAINRGIDEGYRKGFLRNSIVGDPIKRGTSCYSPGVIHYDIVRGAKIKITVLPKGFGCENKGKVKMFRPTAQLPEIKKFIIDTVKEAGPDACPPYFVGVGIGGTQDEACVLAKKALLRKVTGSPGRQLTGKIEKELLKELNKLNIGPMGLGGTSTVLGIKVLAYPTHIAGLPVCVNISCHALRSATVII